MVSRKNTYQIEPRTYVLVMFELDDKITKSLKN